jgi:hypothetical protein
MSLLLRSARETSHSVLLSSSAPLGISIARSGTSEAIVAKRTSKRELIDTGRNKMYARRDERGQFKEMDDVGRSLTSDRRRSAKTASKLGQGDRGDRKR